MLARRPEPIRECLVFEIPVIHGFHPYREVLGGALPALDPQKAVPGARLLKILIILLQIAAFEIAGRPGNLCPFAFFLRDTDIDPQFEIIKMRRFMKKTAGSA